MFFMQSCVEENGGGFRQTTHLCHFELLDDTIEYAEVVNQNLCYNHMHIYDIHIYVSRTLRLCETKPILVSLIS